MNIFIPDKCFSWEVFAVKTRVMLAAGRDEKGAVAPFLAFCLVTLLIAIGLMIDVGHVYVVRAELQNAADAGANAGAQGLFIYNGKTPVPGTTHCDLAQQVAREAVQLNQAGGKTLTIPTADAEVGIWEPDPSTGKWGFTPAPCSNSINAVRVTTRRTAGVNGPVPLMFARLLGKETQEITARAVALMGWARQLPFGAGFPIALGDKYVPDPGEKMFVTFNPNTSDTGGWHTFFHQAASASYLRGLVDGSTPSPEVKVGDFIEMTNGVDTSVVKEMKKQFENVHNGNWLIILPVVPGDTNYNQQRQVLGFCAFQVTEVKGPPHKTISGWALGAYVGPGTQTGGPSSGLRAGLPKLVQ